MTPLRQRQAGGRRRPLQSRISPAVLTVDGDVAVLTVDRALRSPNRSLWAHWSTKHREARAWKASLKNALVGWLDDQARSNAGQSEGRARQMEIAKLIVTGDLSPAPEGRYRVDVTRIVPLKGHLITDEENLRFSTKHAIDALVSLGFLYSDRREWLELPLPTEVIEKGRTATIFRISPWWRAR